MKIVICDDDHYMLSQLKEYLLEYAKERNKPDPEIVCYSDGRDLLKDSKDMDYLFLDIEMPGVSGIEIGKAVSGKNPRVKIFVVTSYMEYLDDAMRFHVYRYLSKPIDKNRLFRNLDDAFADTDAKREDDKILVSDGTGNHMIHITDIVYVEALRHKTRVFFLKKQSDTDNGTAPDNGEVTLTDSSFPMKYWYECLDREDFYRTNRSYIVNMRYVSDFDHGNVYLCKRQYAAILTARKYTDFKQKFYRYIETS